MGRVWRPEAYQKRGPRMSAQQTLHHQVGKAGRRQPRQLPLSPARLRRAHQEVEDSWEQATKLIDALGAAAEEALTREQCQILKTRWIGQLKMYERLWRRQR